MPSLENSNRLATAKTSFVQAVAEGIDALMSKCGYSRERATNALMRELSRGDSASSLSFSRPSDHEVFETMSRFGLGIEEATKLRIVSRALDRAIQSAGSPTKAIQNLTSKIAVSRLLYDSSDEDPASEDDLPIRPDFRVQPISATMERRTTRSTRKARLMSRTTTSPHKSRKRSMDEVINTSAQKPEEDASFSSRRSRANSVSEEVSAKIAQQSEDSSSPSSSSSSSVSSERKSNNAVAVRSKRSAAAQRDETDAVLSPPKRLRSTGAGVSTAASLNSTA